MAVVERPLGLPGDGVHGALVHLVLYGSVEHVERLPGHLLEDRQVEVRQRGGAGQERRARTETITFRKE